MFRKLGICILIGYYTALRAMFMAPLLFISSFLFLLVSLVAHYHISLYYIIMFLAGLSIGGPYLLMPGAIAADLVMILELILKPIFLGPKSPTHWQ